MPYLTKKTFDSLQRAGNEMSNLCFNLSQDSEQKHGHAIKEAQVKWDAAKELIRQEFVARQKEQP